MPVFFPQLLSGASSQFPLRKTLQFRTVSDGADGVPSMRVVDDGIRQVEWVMQLRGLRDEEIAAITTLYQEMRGTHGAFVFCDPEDNLLVHSEDLNHAAWNKSPGITVSLAPTHAPSTGAAWRLAASGSAGEVWQQSTLPADYQWVLSLYARADAPREITLLQRSSHGERHRTVAVDANWRRYWIGGSGWPAGEGMDVGIRINTIGPVDVSGFQLEGQLSPSFYKRTTATCGVYPEARFADERLRVTTIASNCHQTNLRVVARLSR